MVCALLQQVKTKRSSPAPLTPPQQHSRTSEAPSLYFAALLRNSHEQQQLLKPRALEAVTGTADRDEAIAKHTPQPPALGSTAA